MSYKAISILSLVIVLSSVIYVQAKEKLKSNTQVQTSQSKYKINKSNEEWKKLLSKEAYYVLREKGTERAFTGMYHNNHEEGDYYCSACGEKLFSSKHKFDSGTGWPSFYQAIEKNNIEEETDNSFFMTRTEVKCNKCGGHLGHVFDDGPKPTGLRYCINSVSLKFQKAKKTSK
jgi:peptide-methionine (R)-S-oxide reductase